MEQGVAIVVDIGKTHAKVSLWSKDGRCLDKRTRSNAVPDAGTYRPLDTAGTASWLIESLGAFAGHPVESIVPVTHGAAVVGLRNGVLAFAPMDYEWDIPAEALAVYRSQRDAFAVTGSPALPLGLNIGAQLHWLDETGALDGVTLMPYAQYWAWLLSGVAVSEVTSLGCHSDLWEPAAGSFSQLARARGWADSFAPLVRAGDAVGPLQPDLAELTGLPATAKVHAGLHDSNAALLAARAFPEMAGRDATVLSTGTWFIAMRTPSEAVDLAALPEARDCLVNVDAFGQPVPSARFMGGREIELLGARIDLPGVDGLNAVLEDETMVLPSQIPGCGPFPVSNGKWVNRPDDTEAQRAAVALYAALMADASLGLIGATDTLLIEGRFAASELFTRALATLRPDMKVFTASTEADVSFGALTLVFPDLAPQGALVPARPLDRDLAAYREQWLSAIEGIA